MPVPLSQFVYLSGDCQTKLPKQNELRQPQNKLAFMGVVLVFGILITGLWSELDRLSPIVAVSLIIISVVAENLKASKKSKLNVRAGLQLIDGREVLLTTLLSLPVFLSLLGKLQGEFPFSGDHDHHAAALLAGANYWKSAGWIVAAAIVLFSLV